MGKNLISKRIKFSLLFFTLVVSILSLFNYNFIYRNSVINQKESFYKNSDIDFDIPSPSFTQLEEISNNPNVEKVFGYHFAPITLMSKNSKERNLTLIMSDYFEQIEFTGFGLKNSLFNNDSTSTNFVFLDYKAAELLGTSLNEEVNFEFLNKSYKTSRILNSIDYFPGGVVFLPYQDTIKNYFDQFIINNAYSGAFIQSNNIQQLNSFLIQYKPLGRLFPRESFSTDTEYQIHLATWNNSSYYNEITNLSSINFTEINNSFLIFSSIFSVLILFVYQYFLFFSFESNYFKNINDNIGFIKNYFRRVSIIESAFFLFLSFGIILLLISFSSLYFPFYIFIPTLLSYVLIFISFVVFIQYFKNKAIKITV